MVEIDRCLSEIFGFRPTVRIDEICASKRTITADTAMRLARFFSCDAQSWMNLQAACDLETAELKLADKIGAEVTPHTDAA